VSHSPGVRTRSLVGRTALVTGGSRGIGRAVAIRLAADGAKVAINYNSNVAAAEEVVALIAAAGGHAECYQASVSDADAILAMLRAVRSQFGPIDLFVSNAGSASSGRDILTTDASEYLRLLNVHTLGPIGILKALLPDLRSAERGDVVMISTALTDTMPAGASAYTMAKVAMEAIVRTLAREERRHGIRANIVAPGLVATDMGARLVAAATGGGAVENLDANYPFGRVSSPEDVAGVVAFLVSEDASYMTGQRLLVDGGGKDIAIVDA
jgi:NAD(P)-dependent dehydrogenase (short-subunit alcohol dehydrogenase family)